MAKERARQSIFKKWKSKFENRWEIKESFMEKEAIKLSLQRRVTYFGRDKKGECYSSGTMVCMHGWSQENAR